MFFCYSYATCIKQGKNVAREDKIKTIVVFFGVINVNDNQFRLKKNVENANQFYNLFKKIFIIFVNNRFIIFILSVDNSILFAMRIFLLPWEFFLQWKLLFYGEKLSLAVRIFLLQVRIFFSPWKVFSWKCFYSKCKFLVNHTKRNWQAMYLMLSIVSKTFL